MDRLLNKFILSVFLCLSTLAYSQSDYKNKEQFDAFNRYKDKVARYQINALKEGVLLVRLKTNDATIKALKEKGNEDLATQVQRETYQQNKTIIDAFLSEFTFCPVLFFYANTSDSLATGKQKAIFLNNQLQVDTTIKLNGRYFLIAERGYVFNSSLGLVKKQDAPKAKETGNAIKEVAIVIKNQFFHQLNTPFPFYVKGYDYKKYKKFIKTLNTKFSEFYQKNKGFPAFDPQLEDYLY